MKTIDKIIKTKSNKCNELSFAEFYYEHNGKKFRVHYEATLSTPCASIGGNWYQSLSIMLPDGTWKQVADAQIVGAISHSDLCFRPLGAVMPLLADAEKKFQAYIKKLW